MSEIDNVNPEPTELPTVENLTPKTLAEQIKAEVESEVDVDVMEISAEDLNKRNYQKITSTFYIQSVESEDVDKEGNKIELFKILNPETGVVETRELTDEEKHEILVLQLKESKIKFRPIKNVVKTIGMQTIVSSIGRERKVKEKALLTNLTTNQFGTDYRKARKRKNKMAKASRKSNRKK